MKGLGECLVASALALSASACDSSCKDLAHTPLRPTQARCGHVSIDDALYPDGTDFRVAADSDDFVASDDEGLDGACITPKFGRVSLRKYRDKCEEIGGQVKMEVAFLRGKGRGGTGSVRVANCIMGQTRGQLRKKLSQPGNRGKSARGGR